MREKAKASTAYQKMKTSFLPVFQEGEKVFKKTYQDKNCFIPFKENIFESVNPVEYLISAAAGCCSIGFELQAALAGVKLEQFEISASGGIDMAKLFGMEDGYGGLDNLVLTIKVKADADLPTLQNFADRSAATSPVLNSLKARAKVVVEKI